MTVPPFGGCRSPAVTSPSPGYVSRFSGPARYPSSAGRRGRAAISYADPGAVSDVSPRVPSREASDRRVTYPRDFKRAACVLRLRSPTRLRRGKAERARLCGTARSGRRCGTERERTPRDVGAAASSVLTEGSRHLNATAPGGGGTALVNKYSVFYRSNHLLCALLLLLFSPSSRNSLGIRRKGHYRIGTQKKKRPCYLQSTLISSATLVRASGPISTVTGGRGAAKAGRLRSVQLNKRGLGLSRRWEGESREGSSNFCALTHQYDRADTDSERDQKLTPPGRKAGGPLPPLPPEPKRSEGSGKSRRGVPVRPSQRPSRPSSGSASPQLRTGSRTATSRRPRSRPAAFSPRRKTSLQGPLSTAACGLYLAN